jgi:calcineurin-like phosphoesterase family protein
MIFYISDTHFGHENIIVMQNRPYNSIKDMNSDFIVRWNKKVKNSDAVYILGDMFWCHWKDSLQVLDQLHSRKILIKGNHDKCNTSEFVKKFSKVVDYLEIKDNDRNVVLCHDPIPCFKNHFYGWYHLYGHVHNSFEWHMMENTKRQMTELYDKQCKMYNVGAMIPYMDYTPRTLEQIIEGEVKHNV